MATRRLLMLRCLALACCALTVPSPAQVGPLGLVGAALAAQNRVNTLLDAITDVPGKRSTTSGSSSGSSSDPGGFGAASRRNGPSQPVAPTPPVTPVVRPLGPQPSPPPQRKPAPLPPEKAQEQPAETPGAPQSVNRLSPGRPAAQAKHMPLAKPRAVAKRTGPGTAQKPPAAMTKPPRKPAGLKSAAPRNGAAKNTAAPKSGAKAVKKTGKKAPAAEQPETVLPR